MQGLKKNRQILYSMVLAAQAPEMQSQELCNLPKMQPMEIYNLLRVHEKTSKENALRKAWNVTHPSCKDVIALAFPLKPVPHSLDAFRNKVAGNQKQQDFVMASFYVIHVGRCDGQQHGWSKAPYDSKNKKREEQKPLYTVDSTGESKDQTRFWSFKKVSNNMNKGARVDDKVDDKDLSFVLRGGTCISVFLREDNYDEQKRMFDGVWEDTHEQGTVLAYKPVLLQLSGTNDEQAMKGNGLKLRRVLPAPQEIMNEFCDSFFESKAEMQSLQTETADLVPLRAVTKQMQGCPLLCKVHENAFVYRDKDTAMIEIIDSGMDPNLGKRLLVSEDLLLTVMNSQDVDRALRMLSVAIGHNAVKCVFVQSNLQGSPTDTCTVVHLQVDMAEAMWFNVLHKSRVIDCPTTLPKTSMLTMCFGTSIAERCIGNSSQTYNFPPAEENGMSCLQWFSPSQLVQVATADGGEVRCHVIFEIQLDMKQSAGQRDVQSKVLFMDEVSGFHYVVKVFHAKNVVYSEEHGLSCTEPTLLVTWQLRPGLVVSALSVSGIQRKRVYMSADTLDLMNSGDLVTDFVPPQSHSIEVQEQPIQKKKKIV